MCLSQFALICQITYNHLMKIYYFGCWAVGKSGHHLFDTKGSFFSHYDKVADLPKDLQPKYLDNPPKGKQSQVFFEHIEGYSVISLVDQSGDSRPGSHSKFIIEGIHSLADALKLAEQAFPLQVARIRSKKEFYQ